MALDTVIQVGANVNPALGPLKKVEDAMKRIQGSAFNLKLNARNFTEPLGRISGQVSEFEKSLEASNARVLAFGASAGVLFQFIRTLKETVRATVEVEKSLTDINVIFNKNEKQIKSFGRELFKIASQTGQSFNVVAEAATELARQGLSITETQKRVKDALILTRLSGMSAKDSVESLTAALNTFKDVGLTSTQVINKLANVDAAFAVSTGDLAEALKRVGSTAQDVGVTFDQLNGLVASLQQTTARGGSVIGNSLKTIFTRIGRPETLRQLEALGLTVRDNAKNTLPAINILKQLANVYGSLSDAQKSDVTQTVAGVFQKNILIATLKDLSKANSEYQRAVNTSADATDQANQRNKELNKTLAAQTQRLLNNFKQVGAGVGGNIFGPSIQTIFGSLNKVLESGDSSSEFVQAGLSIGDALTKGIGKTLSGPGLAIIGLFAKNILKEFASFSIEVVGQLKNMGTAAQTFSNVQQNISNILRSQPDIMMKIANGQTTIAREAAKVTQQLAAQRDLAIGINAASGPLAAAVVRQSGGIKKFNKSGSLATGVVGAAGGNPKMFSSLAGAINNEIRAGVPRSSIRINSSSSLAHSGNPMGLAVTNLKDEPMGLRSLGIPNFADPFRFTTTKGTVGGQLKLNRKELDEFSKALKSLNKEGKYLGDVFSQLRSSVKSKKGSGTVFNDLIEQARLGYKGSGDIVNPYAASQVLAGRSGVRVSDPRLLPALRSKNPLAQQMASIQYSTGQFVGAPSGPMVGPSGPFQGPPVGYTLGPFGPTYGPNFPQYMPPSTFGMGKAPKSGFTPPSTLRAAMFSGSTGEMFGPAPLTSKQKRSLLNRNFLRQSGQFIGDKLTNFGSKISSGRGMMAGFAGSALLSSVMPESPITSIANAGLTGGIFGSYFGPLGAGIGAIVGASTALAKEFGLLQKAVNHLSTGIEKNSLDKKVDEFSESLNSFVKTSSQNVFNEATMSNSIISRVSMGKAGDFGKFLSEQFEGGSSESLRKALANFYKINESFKNGKKSLTTDDITNLVSGSQNATALARSLSELSGPRQQALFGSDKGREAFRSGIVKELAVQRDKSLEAEKKKIDLLNRENQILEQRASILRRISSISLKTSLQNIRSSGIAQRNALMSDQSSFMMFGGQLINFQQRQNINEFNRLANVKRANVGRQFQSGQLSAISSLAQSLSGGNAAAEKDIIEGLTKSGGNITEEFLTSYGADKQGQSAIRSYNKQIVDLQEKQANDLQIITEELSEQVKTEKLSTQVKKFKLDNEFKQQRLLQQFNTGRAATDAAGQFRIGAIGGAGLADANQAALSANIAANGLRRGDYGRGFNIAIRRNFQRNNYDVFQSTISAVDELSLSLKDGLKNALVDTILQARTASEAFGSLANALSRMALEKGLDMFFTAALSKIPFKGNNKGGRVGYASGGLVTGGSSANVDTVPAMLSSGEFVMRRAAVNRIGVGTLNAINSGGFSGLQSGGYANVNLNNSTDFLGNPRRPTGMSFNIDPSLSAFALTSSMNRQNQIRDEKAKQFMSYRRSQLSALAAFEKQKKGRRMGALVGALTALGGAGISSMGAGAASAPSAAGGASSIGGIGEGIPLSEFSFSYARNSGGSIPTMLTQGEFVINRQAASRLGGGMLGRMNSGSMSFNSGGATSSIPSQENGTDRVVEAIKELKATFEQKPQTKSQTPQSQQGSTPVNISVPISVNVTAATENVRSETENSNATEEQDSRQAMAKQLSENMRAVVLQEIEKQKRPGGTLYNL